MPQHGTQLEIGIHHDGIGAHTRAEVTDIGRTDHRGRGGGSGPDGIDEPCTAIEYRPAQALQQRRGSAGECTARVCAPMPSW